MTTVFEISMSLDGYVTAAGVRPEEPMGDGGQQLHEWAFGADGRGREVLAESMSNVGRASPVGASTTCPCHGGVRTDIADTNDQAGPLFDWYDNGDVEVTGAGPGVFHTSASSAECLRAAWSAIGAGVRYFGDYAGSPLLLDDPQIVQGDRMTHLHYRLRKS